MAAPLVAGVDEVGRGALAGPLLVAAVILPPQANHPLLRDSKALTPTQRKAAAHYVQQIALAWTIVEVPVSYIDEVGILQATLSGMAQAIQRLSMMPALVLIDGPHVPALEGYRLQAEVKGDARHRPIAAASILAKVTRDRRMQALHADYPAYGWAQNKGYPTAAHRQALKVHGPSPWHRKRFLSKLLPPELPSSQ